MRILIVSQYFWPENFRINDLVEGLAERGHEVTVLTGEPNYPEGQIFPSYRADPQAFLRFGDVPVVRVPVVPRGASSLRLVLNYLSFALSASLLGGWKLRRQPIDAIFVFQTSPVTAALPAVMLRCLKRAPMLMWILDLWPDTLSAIGVVESPRLLAWVGALVRFIYKRCDRILVQSRAFTPKVAALAGGSDTIRYFPGWAEAMFKEDGPAPARAPELASFADDFKILFAGNIGEAQDFPAIIEAADATRHIDRLSWIIVGDGRAAADAVAEVRRRRLESRVHFLGRFPLDRMPSFFAGADALLVSLAGKQIWSMTIPGKVQSYLAAGKPILGMLDGEGARVLTESGAGLVAPAGDGGMLAEQVKNLILMDGQARAAMGRSGMIYCGREFGRERMISQLETWIREIADGDGRECALVDK